MAMNETNLNETKAIEEAPAPVPAVAEPREISPFYIDKVPDPEVEDFDFRPRPQVATAPFEEEVTPDPKDESATQPVSSSASTGKENQEIPASVEKVNIPKKTEPSSPGKLTS